MKALVEKGAEVEIESGMGEPIGYHDAEYSAAGAEDTNSSIFGMPIIEVDRSKTVIVLKRSMAPGFAGIDNSLFYKENTRMLFGDAKSSIEAVISQFKEV